MRINFRLASRANNEYIGDNMTAVLNIKESGLNTDESDEEQKIDSDQVMFTHASQLADEGLGSFEQCLAVVTACKGDINRAKKML